MLWLMLKNFLRSRSVVTGLFVVLSAGMMGIFTGRQHMHRLQKNIETTVHLQQEHIQRNTQLFHEEMGLLLYHLRFSLVNQPHPLNALSIGQRDVNSSIQSLTIRNLEAQQYDTDLFNPCNLLAGNLDFSFVLIYLFPLLVIGFTYNILSEEKEGGTWKLVSAQSSQPVKVLVQKLSARLLVVGVLLLLLILLVSITFSLPFNSSYLAVLVLSALYILFWFSLSFWVISLQKKSSTNAVVLLSAWLLLTVILPGMANNFIVGHYPVPEAMATTVAQREGYHEKWDIDPKTTMDKFYAHYPQFRKYGLPGKQFSWAWYYAMQQMGDDDAARQSMQMREKLWQREKAASVIACFIPTVHAQYHLNTLARSGLADQLHFLDSTARFHEKMRLHFYPKIFEDAPVSSENWQAFTTAFFTEHIRISWGALLLPSVVLMGLFTAWGGANFRKRPAAG